jgi:hypothetical protein
LAPEQVRVRTAFVGGIYCAIPQPAMQKKWTGPRKPSRDCFDAKKKNGASAPFFVFIGITL